MCYQNHVNIIFRAKSLLSWCSKSQPSENVIHSMSRVFTTMYIKMWRGEWVPSLAQEGLGPGAVIRAGDACGRLACWPLTRASCTPPHPLAPPHHCTLIIPHCCTLLFCQSSVIYAPHTILVMDAPPKTRLRLTVFMEAVSLIISSECSIVLVNTEHCL